MSECVCGVCEYHLKQENVVGNASHDLLLGASIYVVNDIYDVCNVYEVKDVYDVHDMLDGT